MIIFSSLNKMKQINKATYNFITNSDFYNKSNIFKNYRIHINTFLNKKSHKMKNNFKQQFEDSEANFSDLEQNTAYQNPGFQDNQQGVPIQLAKFNQVTKRIQLDSRGLDIIAECDLPVGFVTFAGKYRIGKSFLLNRMLGLPGAGFKVSNMTRQCTKGIWMWSKPFYSSQNQCYLFFLDTQGTQALQKQAQTDIKLFTLNCLLSTYLVFNSVGNIDERSIEQLNLVTALSKNILIDKDVSNKQNQEQLPQHMPRFMWLLRDFTLELRDDYGKPITPTDYLQKCLKSQTSSLVNTSYRSDQQKIKNELKKLFTQRQCLTLVRPASQQRQIQKLNQLPDHALRRDFLEGVNRLKATIFKNAKPKYFGAETLSGGQITSMLESYVQSLNNGSIPKIRSAWQQIGQDQGTYAFNKALQIYNEQYSKNFVEDKPFSPEILYDILADMRQKALQQFNNSVHSPNETFHTKLKQYLKGKEKSIVDVNRQMNEVRNVELLKDLSMPLMRKIESGLYKDKKKNISKDVDEVVKVYNAKALGETKGEIISQFLTTLNPIIISIVEQDSNKQNVNNSKLSTDAIAQFEKRQKALQQQLQAIKNQSQAKDAILKKKQQQLKVVNQQLKKKSNTTCCQIM